MEGEHAVNCSPTEVREAYAQRFAAHAALVRQLSLAAGCDYRRVSTGISYLDTLGGFLVERGGVRKMRNAQCEMRNDWGGA